MTARERLTSGTWETLDAMMAAYAAEAVRTAQAEYRETLDYAPASVERLERILNRLCPAPDPLEPAEGEWLTKLWGAYYGELLRREYAGEWTMSVYPGGTVAVPTIEVAGSRMYPLLKINRRLTMGASEELPKFHAMITARLSARPG